MTRRRPRRLTVTRVGSLVGVGLGLSAVLPATVLGHALNATYTSRLPLAVYLAGAATTVALSFIFVLARDVRAMPRRPTAPAHLPPRALRIGLRVRRPGRLGCGSSPRASPAARAPAIGRDAVPVGLRLGRGRARLARSSGRSWHFLDPFSTLHDLGAGVLRRLGVRAWDARRLPGAAGPLAGGHRLRGRSSGSSSSMPAAGPSTLFVVLVGYTAFTLAMMAQFGRDTWRSNGETFTVWFRLLGRLAPFGSGRRGRPRPPPAVRQRAARAGLVDAPTSIARRARRRRRSCSTACRRPRSGSTCSALPALGGETLLLLGFLGLRRRSRPCCVTRVVGVAATGAGLLPIALGYLIAHYLTYLLIDGQRHPDRDLRPVPARLGPVRHRLPRAVGRVAAAGPRLDGPARGRRRRAHAGRLGRPRRGGRATRRAGIDGRRASAGARSRSPSSWSR